MFSKNKKDKAFSYGKIAYDYMIVTGKYHDDYSKIQDNYEIVTVRFLMIT